MKSTGSLRLGALLCASAMFLAVLPAIAFNAEFASREDSSSGAVSLSTLLLDFKIVPVGQTSSPMSVTLTNTGTGALNISSIVASGDYHISNNTCGATVAAGANCSVSVTLTPIKKGSRLGTLIFTDSAPDSPQSVNLKGIGRSIVGSASSLNFGTAPVGTTTAAQTVIFTNVGPTAVHLFPRGFLGGQGSDFVISADDCPFMIAPAATCSISIEFRPIATGTRKSKLVMRNNGGGSPAAVIVTGVGS